MASLVTNRAGPLFGLLLVVIGAVAAVTPAVSPVRALDPTPDPSASVDPSTSPAPSADASASIAPSPSADPGPSGGPGVSAEPSPSSSPSHAPASTSLPAGPSVTHVWVDTQDDLGAIAARGAMDAPLGDGQRFTVYRLRFQVVNNADTAATVTPTLAVLGAKGGWTPIPAVDPVVGQPFYAASDAGRTFIARDAAIAIGDLRLDASPDAGSVPVPGVSSSGINPGPSLELPAHSFTEVEFAVRGTVNAAWGNAYTFRLLDRSAPLAGTPIELTMGARPAPALSPGQRTGTPVGGPVSSKPSAGTAPKAAGRLVAPEAVAPSLQFPLAGPTYVSPHANYTLTSDFCAACHSSHDAQGPFLGINTPPQSNLCFVCHDGLGAVSNVKAQWTSPTLPANDPATSSWYSHPATAVSNHVSDRSIEFAGVLNRHSVCADCHQPHNATPARGTETPGGWTAAGAIEGASGVVVTNGAAGTAPLYALDTSSALEYQLCFKCHSGYTQLPAQDPLHPSRWALDKAVELNPANVSFHPIESQGRNQSNAMGLSLAGDAPGKLWAFSTTSLIRCTNCHGAPASVAGTPGADARIDNHASTNRGILLAPYRDRSLKSAPDLYSATDFSLCYLCHAETPMVDDSGDVRYDTNFNWHGFHLKDIWYKGTGGTSIDVAGDGQGNAICAECHFRLHSSALAVNGQAPAPGLVNFAPDVTPNGGVLRFVPATSTTLGTCTLTCHGKAHLNFVYAAAP